ncbi:MAG: hypothetical protein JWM14_154 [Chitinophagaceae bacterium]|nr:hypothetical protein [Chitinophagaceae bacterium]
MKKTAHSSLFTAYFYYLSIVKPFIYFFACYIFAITLAPCQDAYTCEDQAAHEASHSHEEDDMDTCSPFCICSCCNTASVLQTYFVSFDFPKVIHHQKNHSPYLASMPLPVYNSIWQPPKL